MEKECRYFVLKWKDLIEALSGEELNQLLEMGKKVDTYRKEQGKTPFEAVVVESDWPEYEQVWQMVLQQPLHS